MKVKVMKKALFFICILQMICLVSCGKEQKSEGEKQGIAANSWQDYVVEIDGNLITEGDLMTDIEALGYSTTDDEDYYNAVLKPQEQTWEIEFKYKGVDGINFSQYNDSQEELPKKNCHMESLVIKDTFYTQIDVTLPGGLKVEENTTIDDIIKVWGDYSIQNEQFFIWKSDNGMIAGIWTKEDKKTVSEIRYAGWHNSIK